MRESVSSRGLGDRVCVPFNAHVVALEFVNQWRFILWGSCAQCERASMLEECARVRAEGRNWSVHAYRRGG